MSLTDVMSALDYSTWQTIALVIFAATFAAIVVHTLLRSHREVERAARLPLDDASESAPLAHMHRNGVHS